MSNIACITVNQEIDQFIEQLSKELGKEKPELVEEAIINYVKVIKTKLDRKNKKLITEFLEDYLDTKIAAKRIENLKEGKSYTVKAEEVYKELGI